MFVIFDMANRKVASHLLNPEKEKLVIDGQLFDAGMYFGILFVNGKQAEKSKMIIVKQFYFFLIESTLGTVPGVAFYI